MSRALSLRIAGTLCLLTCLGHIVGTFMDIPEEQVAMRQTVSIMEQTMVPMPVGPPKSYMQILDGNNLCTSLLLLVAGLLLFTCAPAPKATATDRVILLVALALVGVAIISAIYFFPVPVVFTGLAALLSLFSLTRPAFTEETTT